MISGAGFAPASPLGNSVEFQGNLASPTSQDETDISVAPPGCFSGFGLCDVDQWISIAVMRKDTLEWASVLWWIKANLLTLQTDSRLSEKIPTGEDLDNPTNDCLTAATWNRLATFIEFLAHEVLTAKGSVMGRDAVGIAELLVGTNGQEIFRTPAGSGRELGLLWGKPKRVWTLRWGRLIDAGNTRNGTMTANGAGDDSLQSTKRGTHGMPRPGVLRHLTVNVESAAGGDTLDRVQVIYNLAVTLHDSGTGLAIGADDAYQVDLDEWRFERDIEIFVFKTGTTGTMELTATLTIEEELRPFVIATSAEDLMSDAISVTDSIEAEIILGTTPMDDAIAVTDTLEVELSLHVQLADAIVVTEALTAETDYHREMSDQIDVHDAITIELLQ